MAGHGDPPEGRPEGLPGDEDDEYRSIVFDESFVRAARLQEFSARERMTDHAPAVRKIPPAVPPTRPPPERRSFGSGPKQLVLLLLVLVTAFGTAVYLGLRNPYRPQATRTTEQVRTAVVPLVPEGSVPGGAPDELLARSPAAAFREGAAGITLPPARATGGFAEAQVVAALTIVKDYLVASSLDPDVLAGRSERAVRILLDPDQLGQFDRSLTDPAADGHHDPIGWLVRFDPARVAPAADGIRVHGAMEYRETAPGTLEVTTDHVFVYPLRPAGATALPVRDASLFTVRRELRLRFTVDDLPRRQVELLTSEVQAGPQSCPAGAHRTLLPLLAGERAKARDPAATDPYATGTEGPALCGVLSPRAEPGPAA
ncbi:MULTISPECIES: hypothetical protein [unclassified Streptomyces]|uniref:SCO2583 family membrane protein n=1 Tax=unclassified Streptomyces TaxID=2593676 RepID=UPI00382BAD14